MIESKKYKGASHINVELGGMHYANLIKYDNGWHILNNPKFDYAIGADELRKIADKLDELNEGIEQLK